MLKTKSKKPKNSKPPVPEVEDFGQLASSISWTFGIIRPVGYALLALFLFDLVDILVPPRLLDPVWEFQTIGALVERVPVPLIGFVMVFFGKRSRRGRGELLLLRLLSYTLILIGLAFLFLIPLGVVDSVRIDRQNRTEINAQVEEQVAQIQPVKAQLERANTERELEALLNALVVEGNPPVIESQQQFQEVKDEMTSELVRTETVIRNQAQATQRQRRRSLLKNSVKWNLGALISGILFIGLWQATDWTRRR